MSHLHKKQSALHNLWALTVPQSISAAENFCSFWERQENPDRKNPTQIYLANNMSVALNPGLGTWIQVHMALTDTKHRAKRL